MQSNLSVQVYSVSVENGDNDMIVNCKFKDRSRNGAFDIVPLLYGRLGNRTGALLRATVNLCHSGGSEFCYARC